MTPISISHGRIPIQVPRRLHQQLERRVQRGSTLRGTLVRDLERYYWLMEQYGDRWRHDDHHAYLLALAEIDLPTSTAVYRHAFVERATAAIAATNLHLVYSFDVEAFQAWLLAEMEEPITGMALLDLLDCLRNTGPSPATLDS